MDLHSRDLSPTLKDLENKYLISDGLMLNPENKKVLKTLISSINLDYDSLMAECIFLSEEDLLPGTQTKRISVEQAKLEFDARVKSWYESVDSPHIGTKSLCPLSAPESNRSSLDGDSRCSGRSSRSSLSSFKRKESLVKLKLALFAKEKEKERSRIEQEAERAKQEAERAKQEAERAKQEAERKANEQERALDVELAKFEVKAWDEVLSDRGDRPMPLRRPIAPSSVPICETLRNAEKEAEQNVEKAVARNENCSVEDKKTMTMTNYLATSKSYANVKKFDGMISQYEQPINNSRRSRKIAEPEYEEDRRNVPLPVTHWHAPAGQSASIPILTSQDYPPPRPVIPNFDGDPLTYWPFIRSFEAHIATKNIYSNGDSSGNFFMTLPVKICHNGKELLTYALLDSVSQRTFCTRRIADELNANGLHQTISISTLSSGVQPTSIDTEAITLLVSGVDENCSVSLREVLVVDTIPLEAAQVPVSREMNNLEHLKDISFKELSDKTIGILIGVDASVVFRALESRFGPEGTPDAIRTSLGWVLFGPALRCQCCAEVGNDSATDTCMHVTLPENAKVDPSLPPHEYEVGCGLDHDNSREDRLALKIMKDSIKIVNCHFQLPLLWRHKNVFLPDNRAMAEKRLESLKRRFSKDESLHKKYAGVMQDYIEKGFAERVRDDGKRNACTWFLPHHPVMNPRKPDKIRVVFDCAARFMGVSLNDKLLQGPDLLSRLSGVLTRFRVNPIALVADIEAMFHQVKVNPEDRSALQFLWWPDGDVDKRPEVYRMTVHLFGATSSPSCASFCLKQTAALSAENCSSQTIEAIQRAFYVDDCLMSVDTTEEAADLANELRNVLSSYGFRIRKWLSNCERALLKVPEEDRCDKYKELSLERTASQRVLGVHWDIVEDEFTIKVDMPRKPCTRRGILSASHSLFDPLGFVATVLVEIKLLLREMNGDDWDAALSEKKEERWRAWISALYYLQELKIPRCLKPSDMNGELTYELHHFSDASGEAYGAVSYLRITDKSGKVHCSFLMGKSHLAPAPMTTIPRLELLAAIVSLRLNQMLKRELPLVIAKTYFWSDSTSVLLSIYNSSKRFPVFVANRLAEIERNSDIQSWRYVPSKLNPADEATRCKQAQAFVESSMWLSGPEFLQHADDEWPEQLESLEQLPEEFPLFEKGMRIVSNLVVQPAMETPTDRLIEHFSSLHKLKKSVAWYLRLFEFLKRKRAGLHGKDLVKSATSHITVEELKSAELKVAIYEQRRCLSNLILALKNGNRLSSKVCSRSIRKLNPFISHNVVRVGGRLGKASISADARHPIILPSNSHFTKLVIRFYHLLAGHSGFNHTSSTLSQRFWIERGGYVIRNVLKECTTCQRQNAQVSTQLMADLPECRLDMNHAPFFHTGVDCFGVFSVKQGRSLVKRYGCIFTCMTVRAAHLEVLHTLSTDSFISALRRFVARRGNVGHIYSDNGTNFVGAEKVLKESIRKWNQRQISEFLVQKEVDWHFNTPLASHFGGSWERLIRSVRKILTSITSQTTFTEEGLTTLFVEVEGILNSRPLTPVSFIEEIKRPLTPNDVLQLCPTSGMPPTDTANSDSLIARKWRHAQHFANLFWRRWAQEYLPTIKYRQKWYEIKRNVMVNDIVILVDKNTPRSKWPLGRILKTFPDPKGFVRSAIVKMHGSEVKRPVSKMCVVVPATSKNDIPSWISTV